MSSPKPPTFISVPGPCDLRCAWCNAAGVVPVVPPNQLESMTSSLLELAGRGEREVGLGLLHTEPTTHPDLIEVIKRARSLGFRRISLSTSGIRLADPELAREVISAGVDDVVLTLISLDQGISDLLFGALGATRAKLEALHRCLDQGAQVRVVVMLLRPALLGTPAMAAHLAELAEAHGESLTFGGCLMDPVEGMSPDQRDLLWPTMPELAWTLAQVDARVPDFAVLEKILPDLPDMDLSSTNRPPDMSPEALERELIRVGLRSDSDRDPLAWASPPEWQRPLLEILENLRRRGATLAGFTLGDVLRSPDEVRVSLMGSTTNVRAIIEPRSEARRWFRAGPSLTISHASDTPADTPEQRRALETLLGLLERARRRGTK